jgi:hypothetical protein
MNLNKIIRGKNVIILGSAPSVVNITADKLDSYDIIVRLNNWDVFNDCVRCDIWCSYFGKIINNKPGYDGYIWCCKPSIYYEYNKITEDYRWIYEYNQDFFKSEKFFSTDLTAYFGALELVENNPTTGMQAILDCLQCVASVTICGFDFFASGVHNISQPWEGLRYHPDGRPNHSPERERQIVETLENMGRVKWIK